MTMKFLLVLAVPFIAAAPFPWDKDNRSVPVQGGGKTEVVTPAPAPKPPEPKKPVNVQETLISVASKYLYVRETKGNNRSPEIDAWNKAVGVPLGSPYCASYMAAVHTEAGVKNHPNSAWSPSWFPANRAIPYSGLSKGDVVGLYYTNLKRVGHILMIDQVQKDTFISIEGNTSPSAAVGSNQDRDGDGVFRKYRSKALIGNSKNKYARHWSN